jgi:RNA polymerase sigma-70 factor (ECF subfamily)
MDEREYQKRITECVPALYRVARSILNNEHDCADAVQEAVFQGWVKRHQLRETTSFKTWITRIAVNECRNIQRRAMKQKKAVEASIEEMRQPENDSGKMDLEAALSELPDKYRLPIVLYYMEDYPTKTIAGMLEIPEGRLRERMRTARKMLGRLLKHESN